MKKSLTLALGLVALAVSSGVGLAQRKGEEKKPGAATVIEQQALQQQVEKLTQTAFTYQGQLKEGSVPANGAYTFRLALYTAQSGGHELGVVIKDDVVVTNGSFTVQSDFGRDGFSRNECWLEVGVRPANRTDPYTTLSPRQRLTSTPNAIQAQAEPLSRIGVPVGFQRGVDADLVTAEKAADDAVTGAKIASPQAVSGINSPKDAVALAAGDNATVTPGGNMLPIAAQGNSGWTIDKGVVRLARETDSVGIGTKEPTAKLDVDGSIRARGPIRSGNSISLNGLDHTITATDVPSQPFTKQIRIGFSITPIPNPVTFPDIKVGIGTLTPVATLHVDQPNVPNGGEAARVTFQNLTSGQNAIGVNAVELAAKTTNGAHIGVNAQTSINASSQRGAALGRLAQASGFFTNGTITGVLGQSTPSALANGSSTNTSFGVGGLFTGGPRGGTLTLNATGTYWVGGVYGQVFGAVNVSPSAGAVAGVIGIDSNTGTAASYAGYFGGRVRVTNLTGGPSDALVTAETNGTLHSIAFPNSATQVLLGNGTFGPVPGGVVTGTCPSGANFVTKWSSTSVITCSQIFDNALNVGIGTITPNEQLEITKNFRLPPTVVLGAAGVIMSGGNRFIHNFRTNNFFAGVNAGNLNPTLTGSETTGVGVGALQSLTSGVGNTALGFAALSNHTQGDANTAVGNRALVSNISGNMNTGVGQDALRNNVTGRLNTAVGIGALGSNNAGLNNTALGASAGVSLAIGSNNIYISNNGAATESDTIRIGTQGQQTRTFIAGILVPPPFNACPVLTDGTTQLFTAAPCSSSRRFKEHVEDMGAASEVLYHLRPVSFLYKPEYGGRPDLPQFGLIAEEVAKVAPELVAYDGQGLPYTVYYQFLAPMLLNELQKKDTEIGTLRARLDALEKLVEGLTKK